MDRKILKEITERIKSWCRQNLANAITITRMVLAILLFSIVINNPEQLWLILTLGLLAGLSDLIDGPIARRYGESIFGSSLDILADKFFIYPSLIILTCHHAWRLKNLPVSILGFTGGLIGFLVVFETLILIAGCIGIWWHLKGIKINLKTSKSGKKKTFCGFLIVLIWLFSLTVEQYWGFPLIKFSIFVIDFGLALMIFWAYKSLENYIERRKEKNKKAQLK